jgi:putative peptidoglycan lipid II flippase
MSAKHFTTPGTSRPHQGLEQRAEQHAEKGAEQRAEKSSEQRDIELGLELEQERDVEREVGKSAALMSVLVIISRITGFLRTWGQAYALGVTVTASCYTVANNLPNQLYELVMGGMLVTAFLPVYLSVKKRAGTKGASEYASNLASITTLIMGVVFVLSFVFAYQVVLTQSAGATSAFDYSLATYFMRFFAIEIVLYALSSILSGILNAERKYFWSTAAPIFNNFVCTASFFAYAFLLPTAPTTAVLVLAIGNPLGVLIQVLLQVPSLKRCGIRLRPRINWHDPALKETLSIGVPSLVVTFASFITVSVQSSSCLQVTASGAAIAYYARLWYTLPYSVFAIPVTTAMFTELSESYAAGNIDAYKRGIISGTNRILFFLVPLAALLIAFATPLVTLLNSGSFTQEDIALTAHYLGYLALSLPFYGICTYLQKVCSSYRRMGIYAVATVIASVIQVAFCVVLTPVMGLPAVALSSLFFFIAVDVVTFVTLRRSLGALGLTSTFACALRSALLGVLGAAVGVGLIKLLAMLGLTATGLTSALLVCVAAGLPSLVVAYAAAVLLHMPEGAFFTSLLSRVARKA